MTEVDETSDPGESLVKAQSSGEPGSADDPLAGYARAGKTGQLLSETLRQTALLIGRRSDEPMAFSNGDLLVAGLDLDADATALETRARDVRQGLFTIVVLGEFKNGKSTLINAMLGKRALPAKAAPATAVITVLVAGSASDVAIFETGRREPWRLSWEDFVRDFQLSPQDQDTLGSQGGVDRFSQVEYALIETDHPLCLAGLKLVDSPGLGEHVSRTRVATNFLKQSQAVIMVLNASRILTPDETSFIDAMLGKGRLAHVFFVVNRMDQVDSSAAEAIQTWVRSQLGPHFSTLAGSFDGELYSRRVFFINARGALEARSQVPVDRQGLLSSGVPALEHELETFLTGSERLDAMLQSTSQFVGPVIANALHRIQQRQTALDEPLKVLEERRAQSEERLTALEGRKRDTERTVLLFSETIGKKVFADLRGFVDGLAGTWDEDSRRYMDLDRAVSLRSVIASYTQHEARERMAQAIRKEVQRYVQAEFDVWTERISSVIEQDVTSLVAEVEAQIDDLRLELDRISAAFAGAAARPPADRSGFEGARLLQIALSSRDIADITDDALGIGDMGGLLGRMVQQSIVVYIVRTFLTGSFLLATVVVEAVQGGLRESEVKRRIRQMLGDRLLSALGQQVNEKERFIHQSIAERFEDFGRVTTEAASNQIAATRREQESLLHQKRDESFSSETEKRRLASIGEQLRRMHGEIVNMHVQ